MSEVVNQTLTVTLKQAESLIEANPDVVYMLCGEPGIGKTSICKALEKALKMPSVIMSVPEMDLGDICMPVVHHESQTTRYYPNARFGLHEGQARIVCLDEYTKGNQPVQNMLHTMLESYRPRLGDLELPEGTRVFLTGNLESDGVGDAMKAHTRQRVVRLVVSKPNHEEWLQWAGQNGIDPVIMAWVHRHPHALASYLDGDQNGNEFIFNPSKPQDGCVSPRTLERASRILRQRSKFDYGALMAALAGAVGRPASESISSFVRHQDSLPSFEEIIANPKKVKIPKDPGAMAVLTFGMVERVDKEVLGPIIEFLNRADEEWQSIFCITLAQHPGKNDIAFKHKSYAEWVADNADLL